MPRANTAPSYLRNEHEGVRLASALADYADLLGEQHQANGSTRAEQAERADLYRWAKETREAVGLDREIPPAGRRPDASEPLQIRPAQAL